jgi:hypothetical protein
MPRANPIMGVDVRRLWEAIAVKIALTDGLTEQGLAEELGIAKQTLWWMHREAREGTGYQPSAQVFLTLCWWLEVSPEEFRTRLREGVSS